MRNEFNAVAKFIQVSFQKYVHNDGKIADGIETFADGLGKVETLAHDTYKESKDN